MKVDQLYGGLTNKSRLIVTLLTAPGMTFDRLRLLTVSELGDALENMRIDTTLISYAKEELIFGKNRDERAFTNPSGRPYSAADVEKILSKTIERNGLDYEGRLAFSKQFKRSTSKRRLTHEA